MAITSFQKSPSLNLLQIETAVIANASPGDAAGDVLVVDVIVYSILISNYGGQAAPKVTVQDRQSTPRPFGFGANTMVGIGGSVMLESEHGIPASGGLNIVCDTTSACTVKVIYRNQA